MRKKLGDLLEAGRVTLVFPAPHNKWIRWTDPATGEAGKRHKSPKTGSVCAVFRELAHIRPLLSHENLTLRVVLLDMEEIRYLNGWSRDKKRGSSRCDSIPLGLCGAGTLKSSGRMRAVLRALSGLTGVRCRGLSRHSTAGKTAEKP